MLAGCGGEKLTWQGQKLVRPEDTVTALELKWRETLRDVRSVNVDEKSRCYLQKADKVVADTAICGPVHFLGDDEQTWMTAPLRGVVSDGGISLMPDGPLGKGKELDNVDFYRPDGKKVDPNLRIPEPAAPVAVPGEVERSYAEASADAATNRGLLRTPDGFIQIRDVTQKERVGDATHRKQAPEGHAFLVFVAEQPASGQAGAASNSNSYSGETSSERPKTEYRLKIGENDYPLELGSRTEKIAIPVPGDGKNAVLTATYDGLTQELALDSLVRRPSSADGFYDGLSTSLSEYFERIAKYEWKQNPDDQGSLYVNGRVEVDAARTPYVQGYGWAQPGSTLLLVKRSFMYGSMGVKSVPYSGRYSWVSNAVKIEGKDHAPKSIVEDKASSITKDITQTLVYEVPLKTSTFTLPTAVRGEGDISIGIKADEEHPAKISATLPAKDQVLTFEKAKRAEDLGSGTPISAPKATVRTAAPAASAPQSTSTPRPSSSSSTAAREMRAPVTTYPEDTSDTACVGVKRRYTNLVNVDCASAKYVADNVLGNGTDIADNARRLQDYTCYAPTSAQRSSGASVPPRVCVKDGETEHFEIWTKAGGQPVE